MFRGLRLAKRSELGCSEALTSAGASFSRVRHSVDFGAGSSSADRFSDVSGKGIGAALLMASLQASLRAQALHPRLDLSTLIGDVNRLV